MTTGKKTRNELLAENEELRLRLEEAEETLNAIRSGEVDALVISSPEGEQVFTLQGAETPYRVLVESMNEGAASLDTDGNILYCNSKLAAMLQVPLERLMGTRLASYVVPGDHAIYADRVERCAEECDRVEISLIPANGGPLPVLFSCCAMEYPGGPGIGVVLTDIRIQKEAEALIREAQLQTQMTEERERAAEALRVAYEELQAANEALHFQEEELRAQAEELATSNRELKWAEGSLREANAKLENRVAERTRELVLTVDHLQGEVKTRNKAEKELRAIEETVQRLNRLYAVVCATNHAIVHATDSASIFNEFCRVAVELGGFRLAWVGLADKESGLIKLVSARGATGYLDGIRISVNIEPEGLGPTGRAVREGTYYICNDFFDSEITRPWHEKAAAHGLYASASIAIKENSEVIGALTLYAGEKNFFDRQHEDLLLQMGEDVSFALDSISQANLRREAEEALRLETAERLRTLQELREKDQMLIMQSRQAAMGEMLANIAHQWRQPLNSVGLVIQQLPLFYEKGQLDGY